MKIRDILKRSSSDTLYLNGMFSRAFTLLPLWMHWKKTIDTRIVLAPRGMLRGSALQIKSWKKNGFLHLFKHAGISQRVRFHATDESEREDIYRIFGKNVFVHVLPNCVRSQAERFKRGEKRPGQLKVISVGRIHPIKNTRYLIDVLSHVRHPAQLDLYGPIEDPGYWKACCRRISELPKHVSVVHRGILPANQIRPTLDR
jgi:glycosyltransferase involved in cell wall biosynthesis